MKTIWDGNDTLKLEVQVMRSSQLRSSPNQVECLHWGQIYCYMAHESLIPNITYLLNNFHFLLSIKPHGFLIKHILVYNSNAWPWFYHVVISMLHFVVIIFSDDVYYVLLPFQNRYKLGHVLICQVEYSPTDGLSSSLASHESWPPPITTRRVLYRAISLFNSITSLWKRKGKISY